MQDSTASRDATAGTGTRTGRDSYRSDEPKSRHDGKATDFDDFETKSGLGDAELGAAPPASAAEPATLSSNQIASSRGGTPPRSRKKPPPQLPVAQEVSSIARVKSHPKPPPLSGMKRTATEEAPPSPSEPLQSRVQASLMRPRVAPPPLASLQRRRQHPKSGLGMPGLSALVDRPSRVSVDGAVSRATKSKVLGQQPNKTKYVDGPQLRAGWGYSLRQGTCHGRSWATIDGTTASTHNSWTYSPSQPKYKCAGS